MRHALDITPEKSFETLKSNVVSSIASYFPFDGKRRQIVLNSISVDDKLDIDDIRSQTEAKDHERTWGVPVVAHLSLIDKATGKVLDTKKTTLATIPKLTSRYGFIVGGNEYQVDHLFRLKSGVYARVQANGELESEFNLAKKLGSNFSIHLNPKTEKFTFKYGTAHLPLYPIMKAMGVSDEQLEHEWGQEVFRVNKTEKRNEKGLAEFFKRTDQDEAEAPKDEAGHVAYVHHFFNNTALLPDTTKATLGKAFTKVDGEVLRLAANKILGVSRGTNAPDDRDSLAFKEIVSVEDFVPEMLTRNARNIKAKIRGTVDFKNTLTEIVSPDLFKKPINQFFISGSAKVIERSEQTNPIQMMAGHRKTTLFSELGGIKNENAVTEQMQVINPSHFGFLDPMHTPESEKTGVTLYLSAGSRKNGRDLEAPAFDIHAGKLNYVKVPDFHAAMMVLPDQVKWVDGKPVPISANVKMKMPGGAIETRPFKEAKYVLPSSKGLFDYTSNLIPFLPTDQGNRVSMADKQMEQAISLKHREAPLVQSKTEGKHTFEKTLGTFSSTYSPVSGTVVSVKKDAIVVSDGKKKHEIHIYDHFPLNDAKGQMHSDPVVKAGDTVKQGQLLADTNFTKDGHLAIGTNLRVGYMPYKGYNYEDGIVISESAAKKLTSDHLYKKNLEIDPDTDIVGKAKWSAFASKKSKDLTKEQFDALDENGVIKVGTKVKPGSVLVAALAKNDLTRAGSALSVLGSRYNKFMAWKDKSLTWDEDHMGEVVKVVHNPNGKGVKVYIKTDEQMVVGDKISGRHGNKGIVTQIIPDHEMPFTKDAKGERKHLEVLLNPTGVPTRINVGQVLETAAGKIAEKTGKPYIVNNFAGPGHDYRAEVVKDLAAVGLHDEENVFDPKDPNKVMGSVLVGPQYLMKLRHQVEKKLNVRGGGSTIDGKPLSYTADRQPVKGGTHGGQGIGQLELYAFLGHNARHNIREMATYKSDKQDDDFWARIQQGEQPPPPSVPFSYRKFEALLKGAGINIKKEGSELQLVPFVDKDILRLAGHGKNEITKGHLTLRSKDLKEERSGLFDPHATGGIEGDKWAFIRTAEPLPSPIFVGANNAPGPIPTLLNLKIEDVEDLMGGKQTLNGKTGGYAIKDTLSKIDVDKEITRIREQLPNLKNTALNRAHKKLKYLLALNETGLSPVEAYMVHNLPIIPPVFRPVTPTDRGDVNTAPINQHYKNFSILNQKMKEFDPKTFSEEHKNPLRADLWNSFKALQAVGKYKPVYDDANGKRKLKGILGTIGGAGDGDQPKDAFFQSKLIKRRQNLSIRSTIIPEPNLHIDEVGLPRHAAMELYKPFVVAQLGVWGMHPLDARKEMKDGTPYAFKALEEVIKGRPIWIKRDPALHKMSVMPFLPKLVEGKAIQIHPLVTGGFNADFDGDTMAGTVPLSREAVEEALTMLPSKTLFSPTSGNVMYVPSQEAMLGLHLISKWGKKVPKTFTNGSDVDKAADKNEIQHTDVIQLNGKDTTLGRMRLAAWLPKAMPMRNDVLHNPEFQITKKTLNELVTDLAKNHSGEFAKTIDALKDLGNEHAYKSGFSVGLKDLKPMEGRDEILNRAHKLADTAKKTSKPGDEQDAKLVEIYSKATEELDAAMKHQYKNSGNRLATMVYSGARGKPEQLRQMVAAPMLMQDATNRTIPTPVTRSYSEGLDIGDYWTAQHGARKGTLQRAQGTSEPGAMSKEILNTTMNYLVTSQDCDSHNGVLMDLSHEDIHDRFLAKPYKLKDGKTIKSGTLLTPEIWSRLKNSKHDKVVVRSPLKCQHGDGICAKCFGLNESGHLHDIGTNIGILAGQAMGEPAVQMAMDAFHSGGVAGGGRGAMSVGRFEKLKNLLSMPELLRNEATLSRAAGEVSAIHKNEAVGGHDVFIGKERHYVPQKNPLLVQVGGQVKKGDALSEGPINPHHLLHITDMANVQNHLTNELYHGLYKKEGVRRRNIEMVVRALTNLTKIRDPGHTDFTPGDVVSASVVEQKNRELHPGETPATHAPILKPIDQLPLTGENWMARLNFQSLSSTIRQAVSRGWKSDLHGSHPIPGVAYGAEFGKPPPTKPKHSY